MPMIGPTLSSPGLGSGLDVNTIVSKLVSVESRPLNLLRTAASKLESTISTYGKLKSLVSDLQSKAEKLGSPTLWKDVAASSANEAAVGVSSSSGAQAATGRYEVQVSQLARAQSLASGAWSGADAVVGGGTLSIQLGAWDDAGAPTSFTPRAGSDAVTIDIAAGATLTEVRDQINAAGAGVRAAIVSDAQGARLTLTAADTGLDNQLRISTSDLAPGSDLGQLAFAPDTGGTGLTQTQSAQNAQATINGLAISASSNTLDNVLDGMTLQLKQVTSAGNPVQVDVNADSASAKAAIEDFVNAYNTLNSFLTQQTAYDADSGKAGALQGDQTAIAMRNGMRTLLMGAGGASGLYAGLRDIGFETAKDGTVSLKADKLDAALSNMDELRRLFSNIDTDNPALSGFGQRFAQFTKSAAGFDGTLSARNEGLEAALRINRSRQERMSDRLGQYEARLLKQYTALDTSMAQMNSMANYVTQQIAALTQNNRS